MCLNVNQLYMSFPAYLFFMAVGTSLAAVVTVTGVTLCSAIHRDRFHYLPTVGPPILLFFFFS